MYRLDAICEIWNELRAVIVIDDIDVLIRIGCDIDINTENEISILFRMFLQKLKLVTNSQLEALKTK